MWKTAKACFASGTAPLLRQEFIYPHFFYLLSALVTSQKMSARFMYFMPDAELAFLKSPSDLYFFKEISALSFGKNKKYEICIDTL